MITIVLTATAFGCFTSMVVVAARSAATTERLERKNRRLRDRLARETEGVPLAFRRGSVAEGEHFRVLWELGGFDSAVRFLTREIGEGEGELHR